MATKSVLGRGLGALIEDHDKNKEAGAVFSYDIDLATVETNPFQPRSEFDEESIQQLASSIKKIGIIQPITVRQLTENRFQLISGERRFRAAQIAGLQRIPAFIRNAQDSEMLELALVENIQREDLNAIEIALSYQRLIDECNLTQESMSERVGKKRSTITNYLRMLKLPAEIQAGVKERNITMGHARALISIEDPQLQLKIYRAILQQGLSVRQTEELARKQDNPVATALEKEKVASPDEFNELKNLLETLFQTHIEFKRSEKGSGKIVIPFQSDNDLERIIGVLDQLNH